MPRDLFSPDEAIPDSSSTGQLAAQAAGAEPAAPVPPPKLPTPPVPPQGVPAIAPPGAVAPAPAVAAPAAPAGRDLFGADSQDEPAPLAQPRNTDALQGYDANRGGPDQVQQDIQGAQTEFNTQKSGIAGALQKITGDPNAQFDPHSGDDNIAERARAGLIATPQGRAQYLKDNLPKGSDVQLIPVPGEGAMTVFKLPGENVYHPLRGADWSKGDIGDILAGVPAVAAQIGMAAATDGESMVGRPLARAVAQGLAGFTERNAETGMNKAQGYDNRNLAATQKDAATTGAGNALADLVGSMVSKGVKTAGGNAEGLFDLPPERQAMVEAGQRQGLPDLSVGQLQPETFGLLESQNAAKSPYLRANKYLPQVQALKDKLASGGPGSLTDSDLDNLLGSMKSDAESALQNPQVPLEHGGAALQSGLFDPQNGYLPLSGKRISSLYDAADNVAQNAQYDLSPLQQATQDAQKGVPMAAGTEQVQSPILDAEGKPMTSTVQKPDVNASTPPSQGLPGILSDIQNASSQVGPYKGNTGYTQLKSLRSRLGDYVDQNFQNLDPEARANYRTARGLYNQLTDIMENPVAGTAPGAYKSTIQAASAANAAREQFLDMADVQAIKRGDNPADFVNMAKPGNAVPLQAIKDAVNPDQWKTYQDAFMTKLASQPESIDSSLAKFRTDPKALNLVLSPAQQAQLSTFSGAMSDIKSSLPAKLRALPSAQDRATQALKLSDGTQLSDLVTKVGGPQSAMGQQLQKGVRQALMDSSTDAATGELNPTKLASNLGSALDSGALKGVLNPADVSQLQDLRTYANAIKDSMRSTMQAGMAAGETAGALGRWYEVKNFLKTWVELGATGIQARTLARGSTGRFFFGGGGQPISNAVRMPVDAAGAALQQQQRQDPSPQPGQ